MKFLGDLFRMFSVCYTPWIDSGHMFRVSLRGLLEEFHTSWTLVFQRYAWFDSGFMLMRQIMEALVWKRHWQWYVQGWSSARVQTWRRQRSSHSCSSWWTGVIFG